MFDGNVLSLNLMILIFIIIHNTLGTFFLSYVNILEKVLCDQVYT